MSDLVFFANFCISKHKANTTELHPKVRQTCCLLYLAFEFYKMFPKTLL